MKYALIGLMIAMLTGCSKYDENYYRLNPKILNETLKECPNRKPPGNISCAQLAVIGNEVNQLAYQLQMNPQEFGRRILAMQQSLAANEEQLKQNPNQADVKDSISKTKQQLAQYLAVVGWLESPSQG